MTLPDSLTEIGDGAFYDCTVLASVKIPCSVIEIGERAFYGCTTLKSVTIPSSVKMIEDGAFRKCTGLTSINIRGDVVECSPDEIAKVLDEYISELTRIEHILRDTFNKR